MAAARQRTRVLLVDAHPGLRGLLAELLADEPGFTVVAQVATGAAALELLRRVPVDLVVVGQHLGDVAGVAVVPSLRRLCPGILIALWAADSTVTTSAPDVVVDRSATFREMVRALRRAVREASDGTRSPSVVDLRATGAQPEGTPVPADGRGT